MGFERNRRNRNNKKKKNSKSILARDAKVRRVLRPTFLSPPLLGQYVAVSFLIGDCLRETAYTAKF